MIGLLRGQLEMISQESIIVNVAGIGFEVRVSKQDIGRLGSLGSDVRLYTYTYVREDQITLYGFSSRGDLDVFKMLISVDGVGPRLAQALIGFMGSEGIKRSIMTEDKKALSSVQGVGVKTASRIILELKPKLFEQYAELSMPEYDISKQPLIKTVGEALRNLGFSTTEVSSALEQPDFNQVQDVSGGVKLALKILGSK